MNSWETIAADVASQLIETSRAQMRYWFGKIRHCFGQLSEDDVWWRPFEQHNALGNIVLHLCGNMRQWLINGVKGTPDVRNRPSEFGSRERIPKAELLAMLEATIDEADAVLASLLAHDAGVDAALLQPRRVQGFDINVQAAIQDAVPHLAGHTQEIIWITRLRRGVDYQFFWKPATKEQGA